MATKKKAAAKKQAAKPRGSSRSDVRQLLTNSTQTNGDPIVSEVAMETGVLSQPMDDATDDIVALEDALPAAAIGDLLQIDGELMSVVDAADLNNLKVSRGAYGSAIETHAIGAEVFLGITPPAAGDGGAAMDETQFVALIAAVVYVRPGSATLQECVDVARNLITLAGTVPE